MKLAWLVVVVGICACGTATGGAGAVAAGDAGDALVADAAPDTVDALADATAKADVADAADGTTDVQCPDKAPDFCCQMDTHVAMVCGPTGWQCPKNANLPWHNPSCSDPCVDLCLVPDAGTAPDVSETNELSDSKDTSEGPDLVTAPDVSETPDTADVASGGKVGDPCGDSGQAACAEPLVCCYPCGMPGCHNQCATPCSGPGCFSGCPALP